MKIWHNWKYPQEIKFIFEAELPVETNVYDIHIKQFESNFMLKCPV